MMPKSRLASASGAVQQCARAHSAAMAVLAHTDRRPLEMYGSTVAVEIGEKMNRDDGHTTAFPAAT